MLRNLQKIFLVLVIGFIFTTVFTWPFLTKLSTLYSDYGDYPLNGWILWYNQLSISSGRILNQQDYFQSNQFYPLPYSLAYSDNLIVPSLIFSPVYWITNNLIFSVNLLVLITFILSFLSSFFVLNYFLKKFHSKYLKKNISNQSTQLFIASLIGSLIYTFNPLSSAHYLEHFQLMQKYFLPPLFLFAYKFFKDATYKNSFFFFLFFTLNALSSFYFQIFSIIALAFFALPWLIRNIVQKNYQYFLKLFKTSFISLIFIPILLYFNLPYYEFSTKEGISRSLGENTFYSARLVDWFIPNLNSFVYEKIAINLLPLRAPKEPNGGFNWSEHTLTLNLLPIFLIILIIIILFKNKKLRKNIINSPVFNSYSLILLVSAIFTFGPLLFIATEHSSSTRSPYYYLYEYFPLLRGIRAPSRFQYIFYVPFSLFLSCGVYILLNKFRKKYLIISFLITLLIFIENFNFGDDKSHSLILYNTDIKNNYLLLLKGKNTLHLPVRVDDLPSESKYLSWSVLTEEKILNGYSGYFSADWIKLMQDISKNLDEENLKKLKAIDLNYIVFHKDLVDPIYYKDSQFILNKGKIYEDKSIIIVDINRYDLDKYICTSRSSFNITPVKKITTQYIFQDVTYFQSILTNSSNCYIGNIGLDRYLSVALQNDGKNFNTILKLPLVITPYQRITFSRVFRNYKFF